MDQLSRNVLRSAHDPMCVPQVGIDPFRPKGHSYVGQLKRYIDFVLEDKDTDTDDVLTIY